MHMYINHILLVKKKKALLSYLLPSNTLPLLTRSLFLNNYFSLSQVILPFAALALITYVF